MSSLPNDMLLTGCKGFRVETARTRIGVVEAVLFGEDAERPVALTIRAGRFGRRLRIIDIGEVEQVDASEQRISVRSDGCEMSL